MIRFVKVALGAIAVGATIIGLGIAFFWIDYSLNKTACSDRSDAEVLSTLQQAFNQSLERSRPEDIENLHFVPVLYRDSSYPEDDPNHSVKVYLTDRRTGLNAREMHLFGDCDIETWGVRDGDVGKR